MRTHSADAAGTGAPGREPGVSRGVINSSHCPFVAMAEYQCCDRNAGHAGYCVGFTAAPEPNPHRPEELCLKTRLRYGETGAGQVSLSPRVSFACAILGSVTLRAAFNVPPLLSRMPRCRRRTTVARAADPVRPSPPSRCHRNRTVTGTSPSRLQTVANIAA